MDEVPADRPRRSRTLPVVGAIAGLAVAALAAVVVLSAERDHSLDVIADRPEDQRRWTGTATLLATPDGVLTLCGGASLDSLPPAGCGGAVVRGLDPMTVPGAMRYENGTVTTPSVRLVGTWDGKALTVTEPFELRQPEQGALTEIAGPSCSEPDGGWPFERVDQDGWSRVHAYLDEQPDAGEPRVDDSQRILTVPFTGDLERHREAIAELYSGPTCVELVERSVKELKQVSDAVDAELQRRGLEALSSSAGGSGQPFVEVSLVAITDRELAELEAKYEGALRLERFLEPLPASS